MYHRFLLALKIEMKCLCLQAMTVIYGQYFEEIGPFTDTKYILIKLEKVSFVQQIRSVILVNLGMTKFNFILIIKPFQINFDFNI